MSEVLITYNNAIHSATKHTPFELFNGRTHIFNQAIKFNSEHDYLTKLNEFREKLYPTVAEKLSNNVIKRTLKLNETRTDPITLQPDTLILRKENRRNKITPRFSIHKVKHDKGRTLITTENQKLHKSKIRKIVRKKGKNNLLNTDDN